MRIGVLLELSEGGDDAPMPPPRWMHLRDQALAAERAGFDLVTVEDSLFSGLAGARGFWESVSVVGALAEATTTVELAHGMFNAPYRLPTLMAKIAETLDEVSGGRYSIGLGAGNTSDDDYAAGGVPVDKRYSRFAEVVEIVHGLLKEGAVDFEGEYYSARRAEMAPRGPRPDGPPIVVAAWGPKMMRLAARFADVWNSFAWDYQRVESFRPMVEELERACDDVGRDPGSLRRTVDIVVDLGVGGESPFAEFLLSGSHEEIADGLLAFAELGVDEVRCNLHPAPPPEMRPGAVESMADIVDRVHAG